MIKHFDWKKNNYKFLMGFKSPKLFCPECGEKMKDIGAGESMTMVAYNSPPGHNHDDNCRKRVYGCENGHLLTISKRNRCPACDWVGKEDCDCHYGKKYDEWPT